MLETQVKIGKFFKTENGNIYFKIGKDEAIYISNENDEVANKNFRVKADGTNTVEQMGFRQIRTVICKEIK